MREAGEHAGECPECGATVSPGLSCAERLGLLIAWEYDDPELAAEHFLTVATYNLQHPAQFTDDAIAGLRELFIEHLDNALPVTEIRRRVAARAAGPVRVLRRDSERPAPVLRRRWETTIADVYLPDRPEGAAGAGPRVGEGGAGGVVSRGGCW